MCAEAAECGRSVQGVKEGVVRVPRVEMCMVHHSVHGTSQCAWYITVCM